MKYEDLCVCQTRAVRHINFILEFKTSKCIFINIVFKHKTTIDTKNVTITTVNSNLKVNKINVGKFCYVEKIKGTCCNEMLK